MYIVIAFISSPKFPKYQMSALCYALDTQRQIRYYALNNFSRKKKGKLQWYMRHVPLEVYLRGSGNTELIRCTLDGHR